MSTTVHEALLNAQINFENVKRIAPIMGNHPIFMIAMEQLNNALTALDNGCNLNGVIQENLLSEVKTDG